MNGFPVARKGEVIGLLGGSFDPAHEGHVRITRAALARFGIDRVWWMLSPGNPLKAKGPAPMAQRLAAARQVMQHPKVVLTDVEAHLGSRYTADTLARLRKHYPGVRFVWLMGADNLAQFHKWQHWEQIMRSVPVGVLARPGDSLAGLSRAARTFARYRIPAGQAKSLGRATPPVWCFLSLPMSDASSSAIRAKGLWKPTQG